ncbi:septal ring lytic transglycosylase RlpA family protein [Helicobacter sp. 11S03491-1]|uniref:septal ring lytic transglycosylase RlpA family protein n=1 Tax=Helicobacter sp. 11S03491-1 TaxID=1476196 RepID=UPI000BA69D94|nr:septal ring lytic transglycosylase RlpA family protein [Helicobacter sp. 11S03491-1]
MGAFSDYEGLSAYRSKKYTSNYANQSYLGGSSGFDGSNNLDNPNPSMMEGMRDSAAIQRATMRPYQIAGKWYYPTRVDVGEIFDGIASWYGPNFHSKKTSNGEIYNMHAHTAASKILPMNTVVKVHNKENNKTTVVRINDRGPFVDGRIIDLSNAAAKDIDMVAKGTAKVRLEILGFGGIISKNYENSVSKDMAQSKSLQEEFKIGDSKNSVEGGNFSLQVGAFRKKEGAQSLKEQTQKSIEGIYHVEIREQTGNGEPIYRVFVEGFKSEDEALDFAKSKNIAGVIIRE